MTSTPALLLLAELALMTSPALAQLQSVPVYPTAVLQRGSSLAVDYGRDLDAATGLAQHIGGRATLTVGPASLEIGAGLWDAGVDPEFQAAGSAGVRLFGTAASALAGALQLGAGYLRSGAGASRDTHITLPLSVGLTFRPVTAGGALLRPWLAPRAQVNRVSFSQVIVNQVGVGASSGIDVALTGRVGFHAAADWSRFPDRRTGTDTLLGGSRLTVGAGVHLRFSTRPPAG